MKSTFTRQEVSRLLLAMVMFSNANNNQGLDAMAKRKPATFGEKVQHLLNVADNIDVDDATSVLSTVQQIKMK